MTHAETNAAVHRSLMLPDARGDRREGPRPRVRPVTPIVVAPPGHVFVVPVVTEKTL